MISNLCLLLLSLSLFAQDNGNIKSDLEQFLDEIPNIRYEKIEHSSLFDVAYEIYVKQPLDHNNPDGKYFEQQIFLQHSGKDLPMVVSLEGYDRENHWLELSKVLKGNQIIIEHRYFGESVPDSLDWKYLTIKQSADDHHSIISLFKKFYTGKWISTGISKGGQTTIFHKYFYPEDVDVAVPYVAPLNFSATEPRIHKFLNEVGSEECRNKILEMQKTLLKRKGEILPLFEHYADTSETKYSIGLEKAYEYLVLEYSFAYWQWNTKSCDSIPAFDSDPKVLFEHLDNVSGLDYLSDDDMEKYKPFFYQAYTEIGFYDYDITPFEGLLKYADGSNSVFWQGKFDFNFNTELMEDINQWVTTKGNNFIYIYGGNDPWQAPGVVLNGKTNSLKMVLENGSHATRIRHFSNEDKEKIFSALETWLDVKIERDCLDKKK